MSIKIISYTFITFFVLVSLSVRQVSAQGIPKAQFQITLNEDDIKVNSDFSIDLVFETNAQISGIDAIIIFEPTNIIAHKIEQQQLLEITPKSIIDNDLGNIKISQVSNTSKTYSGKGTMAKIFFKAKTSGEHRISFDYTPTFKKDSNAILASTGEDILEIPKDLSFTILENIENTENDKSATPSPVLPNQYEPPKIDQKVTPQIFLSRVLQFFPNALRFVGETYFGVKPDTKVTMGSLKGGDLNDDGIINSDDEKLFLDKWYSRGFADYNHDGVVNSADHWLNSKNYQHKIQ